MQMFQLLSNHSICPNFDNVESETSFGWFKVFANRSARTVKSIKRSLFWKKIRLSSQKKININRISGDSSEFQRLASSAVLKIERRSNYLRVRCLFQSSSCLFPRSQSRNDMVLWWKIWICFKNGLPSANDLLEKEVTHFVGKRAFGLGASKFSFYSRFQKAIFVLFKVKPNMRVR